MLLKVSILIFFAFSQGNVVSSQGQQQQLQTPDFVSQGMTSAQMWNPYTWTTPYYAAASSAWTDYLQKAQEVSTQLYQQWDKSGAANMFSMGMALAQQAANEAQKVAEAGMKQALEMQKQSSMKG